MSNPVIDVRNLTKDYGKGRGVFDVSFHVEPGEVFGFLGSNGAGKTVTMRHLMGFIRPQKGTASVLGLDCFNQRAQIQGHLGYLPGEIAIADDMTGIAFLTFMAKMNGIRNLDYMHQLIERLQLDPKPKIRKMSKGTKQKVGLVCAFTGKPQVLLLDEPTSGLDPLMQSLFIQLVLEHRQLGATVFLSSHIFEEVERTCDRVAFIREGRLAAIRSMDEVRASRTHSYQVTFADSQQLKLFAAKAHQGIAIEPATEHQGSRTLLVSADGSVDSLVKELANYSVESLLSREQSLEEMFMGFYGKEGSER